MGCIDLLDEAVLHNHDAIAHGHSLGLVVGNIDEGCTQLLMQLGELGPHLGAQLGVQVGERFVEQEDLGFTHDGTAQGDTLTLTAGQRLRLPVEQVGDIQDAGRLFDAAFDLVLGGFPQFQAESHVLKHGHVRIQRIVLEHHRDVAVFRRDIIDQLFADVQFAVGNLFQAGDHTQGGGFTATGRSDEDDEFLILDLQIEIGNRCDSAGVLFVNAFQRQTRHKKTSQSFAQRVWIR